MFDYILSIHAIPWYIHSIIGVYPCSWTMEELRTVIALLQRPEFKPVEIEDDLHSRIARAVHDKMIKTFDMRENSLDSDQDLTMFM